MCVRLRFLFRLVFNQLFFNEILTAEKNDLNANFCAISHPYCSSYYIYCFPAIGKERF